MLEKIMKLIPATNGGIGIKDFPDKQGDPAATPSPIQSLNESLIKVGETPIKLNSLNRLSTQKESGEKLKHSLEISQPSGPSRPVMG
jgi:hypothetical protein